VNAMTTLSSLPLPVLALLAACATPPPSEEAARPSGAAAEEAAFAPVAAGSETAADSGARSGVQSGTEPGTDTQSGVARGPELGSLRDPGFHQRFLESYLSDTETEPEVAADERETMQKLVELLGAEKLDEAAAVLAERRSPQATALFDFWRGNIHYQKEELQAAAAAYQVAVDKHPKFKRAWTNLAQVRYRQGDFAGAIPAFARVIELGGADGKLYGLLGVCHARGESYVAAESAFRMATMMDPGANEWKMGLAESLFRQARYSDAASLLQALIAEHPERPELWRLQGEAYWMSNQPMQAAENFEMTCRLGGDTPELLENLGLIYAKQEVFDLAVDSYLAAAAKKKEGSLDATLRAAKYMAANGALLAVRRLVEGLEATRGSTLSQDDRKELLRLRARIAAADGASDEEARVLGEIVELDPLDGDALILLGRHCVRQGEFEKAAFWFERAEGIAAFEAEAKLRHGELLVKQGQYAQALPHLRRAQALRPREDVQKYLDQVERNAQGR